MDFKFKVLTYNSTGMGCDKRDFVKNVFSSYKPDVMFIQETWLIESKLNVLNGLSQDYLANGVAATHECDILIGRPKGGLAILWHKTISNKCKFIRIPNTRRACALEFHVDNQCFVLVNMYLPVDNQSKNRVCPEFLDTMDAVELFIQQCNGKHIIIGGDMNLDVKRGNAHDKYYKDWCDRLECCYVHTLSDCTIDYTYNDPAKNCFSCLDHFTVNRHLQRQIVSASVCDEPLNPSYHMPVLLNINITPDRINLCDGNANRKNVVAWHKINEFHINAYHDGQEQFLSHIDYFNVAYCNDTLCKNASHRHQIDVWCDELVKCCLISDNVFPNVNNNGKSCRPGWSCEVKPYRDDCVFWHRIWKDAGCPRNGVVYDVMKLTKKQYVYANRRNKRKQDVVRKEKMATAIANDNMRDFFKEVKKLEPKINVPVPIDGIIESKAIAQHFASKYDGLFNSVPSDPDVMLSIRKYIDDCKLAKNSDRVVKFNEVFEAIKTLKCNKSDGSEGFMSNHLILSCDRFIANISMLFTAMLTHGYQPRKLLEGTIESIPKDKRKDLCMSSNYRGITLCNSISKLFDMIILSRYSDNLSTSELQFAFKSKHSTAMCTLVLKEIVRYYSNNGSKTYSCYIDATKAFDRVRYDKLFGLLIERGIPPIIVRVMLNLYERQCLKTHWRGFVSDEFRTSNGIRQGGVISPVLFCIYIDELLTRLERHGEGCWVGNQFYGAIGYADDLTLLAPTVSGLSKMIKVCEDFSNEYNVKYNPDKTVCMLFSKKDQPDFNVALNGKRLSWVKNTKYLGNYLDSDMTEKTDVRMKRSDMVYRVNHSIATLGKCKKEVMVNIFNSKCCHFYGTQAWNLHDNNILQFQTMWNRSIRRILELPVTTHCILLPGLVGRLSATEQIYCRSLNMTHMMLESKNTKVRFITGKAMMDVNSIIYANMEIVAKRVECTVQQLLKYDSHYVKLCMQKRYSHVEPVVGQITELLNVIYRTVLVEGFDDEELKDILYVLCTA